MRSRLCVLTALVASLKGAAHASYTTIQALLSDVRGIRLSTGQLARLVRKASEALEPALRGILGE